MSRLLSDVANLAGYDEPVTAQMELDTLRVAREYAGLLVLLFFVLLPKVGASFFQDARDFCTHIARSP